MPTTKTCRQCGIAKPVAEFSCHPGSIDGYRSQCKPCRAAAVKSRRHDDPATSILANIIQRCHNTKHPKYRFYGGRGIAVCDAWRGRDGADAFAAHIGPRPSPAHSVDRIDNTGDYEPGNVRWATQQEQMNNTRRNVRITVDGETLTLRQWSQRTGIKYRTLEYRYHEAHWTPVRVVTEPVGRRA